MASKARRAASRSTLQEMLRDRAHAKGNVPDSDSQDQRSWETVSSEGEDSSSLDEALVPEELCDQRSHISSRRDDKIEPVRRTRFNFKSKRITGPFWDLSLTPLSSREERSTISQCRWHGFKHLPFGEYKVAPDRYDIKIFQRKFWISRCIRQAMLVVTLNKVPDCKSQILFCRNSIFSLLGNGTGKLTTLQRKLLASVYYCLRQTNRLSAAGKL
jgi:hypothetical protein